jgi:hypothetical protein
MHRHRTQEIFCLTLPCFMAASSAATEPKNSKALPTADEKQRVIDLSRGWVAAEIKHDANTLRRILDDKFIASFGWQKTSMH